MTKQEMIDKIYEVVADKTLSFWLKYSITVNLNWEHTWEEIRILLWEEDEHFDLDNCDHIVVWFNTSKEQAWVWDIIWHPVMIWDILDWIKNNPRPALQIFKFWELTRKPIEDQSEECIEFIYNLINA